MNNEVIFYYIKRSEDLPAFIDRSKDAVYFVEDAKQIWVGDKLLADHIDPVDLAAYLQNYQVKDIEVEGSGDVISQIDFNPDTGVVTAVRGTIPSIGLGVGTQSKKALHPGDEFTGLSDISVSGHAIYPSDTTYTLPDQISDVQILPNASNDGVDLSISTALGKHTLKSISSIKSAALHEASEFAPKSDIQRIDDKLDSLVESTSGAMHFLGISTTKIEDGERNHPTIAGDAVDTKKLTPGDVVLYSPKNNRDYKEFVWALGADGIGRWSELGYASGPIITPGDGTSVNLDVDIEAGSGLTGGGNLQDGSLELSHYKPVTRPDDGEVYGDIADTTHVIASISVDAFGHIKSASTVDLESFIENIVQTRLSQELANYAKLTDIPIWKEKTDGGEAGGVVDTPNDEETVLQDE